MGYNQFAYCLNNPISLYDPHGTDALIVTDYGDLPIVGHTRIYIQDEDGVWYRTEVYGDVWGTISNYLKGIKHVEAGATITSYNAADEVYDYMHLSAGDKFGAYKHLWGAECVYIEGDFSASVDEAIKKETNNYDYRLLTNSCLTYAREILSYGDFSNLSQKKYNDKAITPVPRVYSRRMNRYERLDKLYSKIKILGVK
jgi:hypothetical protein